MAGKKSEARSQVEAILKKTGSGGKKKGGGGVRKIGRYGRHPSSQRYRAEQRWMTNQLRRVRRHIRRCPGDLQARGWLAGAARGDAEIERFLAANPIP